jgi:hypothetical protein
VTRKKPITTVHLGQFTRESANAIAGRLEKAGIVWWYKEPGYLSQVWEFGVRLFVDRDRLDEAQQIAAKVTASRERKRREREAASTPGTEARGAPVQPGAPMIPPPPDDRR